MGTVSVVVDADGYSPQDASNAGYLVRGKITMSSSYAAGGDTITGALFGLGSITKLELAAGGIGISPTTAYLGAPVYDSSGVNVTKIQVFVTGSGNGVAFSEASGNLSTVVFDCEAYGV